MKKDKTTDDGQMQPVPENKTQADIQQLTEDDRQRDSEPAEGHAGAEEPADAKDTLKETLQKIKNSAQEEDPRPTSQLSLRTILGGDLLTTEMVRSQIWLFVLIVGFSIIYVAFRYQCQQDMINIDRLEGELKDAKFRAMSSSSTLTEKSRESHVLEVLKQNKDSLLDQADQPPYIIQMPE